MFEGIKKLPPAHYLVCEKDNIRLERYWSLSFANKINIDEEEAVERFRDIFNEAVRLRMISDVPLGVFLSGGVDSSVVACAMASCSDKPIKTFAVGFRESHFNELPHAKKVARMLGTEHHPFLVEANCLDVLPKLIHHYNEPFADPSAIPTYYISKMARTQVTVALNGDGGDEAFAGYDRYISNKIAHFYDRSPKMMRDFIRKITERFGDTPEENNIPEKVKRYLKTLNSPPTTRYIRWLSSFTEEMKQSVFSNTLKDRLKTTNSTTLMEKWADRSDAADDVDWALYLDSMTYLPDDLLIKVDVAGMANSLECRSPFLDHKLMEFTASLPSDLKLRGFKRKYLLKEAFRYNLGADILDRKKAGFSVPISEWFRGELKGYIKEVLLDKKAKKRGFFYIKSVENMLNQHIEGKFDHGFRLWCLLNFELWHREFIDP
jgi:asparagine synthase (glutamine-hydrolysing)